MLNAPTTVVRSVMLRLVAAVGLALIPVHTSALAGSDTTGIR